MTAKGQDATKQVLIADLLLVRNYHELAGKANLDLGSCPICGIFQGLEKPPYTGPNTVCMRKESFIRPWK